MSLTDDRYDLGDLPTKEDLIQGSAINKMAREVRSSSLHIELVALASIAISLESIADSLHTMRK